VAYKYFKEISLTNAGLIDITPNCKIIALRTI